MIDPERSARAAGADWPRRALLVMVALGTMGSRCSTEPPLAPQVCIPPRSPDPEGACTDDRPSEPNGSLAEATAGAGCDGTASGNLATPDDVDVYRTGFCGGALLDSAHKVMTATVDADVRLCLFARCAFGRTQVTGCYAATPGDSPPDAGAAAPRGAVAESGFPGCCRDSAGALAMRLQCLDLNKSAEGFVWVDAGDRAAIRGCMPYIVRYTLR